jgi:hypothetical protein
MTPEPVSTFYDRGPRRLRLQELEYRRRGHHGRGGQARVRRAAVYAAAPSG